MSDKPPITTWIRDESQLPRSRAPQLSVEERISALEGSRRACEEALARAAQLLRVLVAPYFDALEQKQAKADARQFLDAYYDRGDDDDE